MKGKRVIFGPITCPQCQKTIWPFKKYYAVYLEWTTKEPWPHTIANRWDICESCYVDYLKYYDSKFKKGELNGKL